MNCKNPKGTSLGCVYSRSMDQPYPRLCINCGEPEPVAQPKPDRETISNTSLRIGLILGQIWGLDEKALKHLIKNADGDFLYVRECEAVLKLRQMITGRIV